MMINLRLSQIMKKWNNQLIIVLKTKKLRIRTQKFKNKDCRYLTNSSYQALNR
jgi:hypothetical protein